MNTRTTYEGLPFLKMHGLGNDFVIFDARKDQLRLETSQIRKIADRRTGIGCDQLLLIENSKKADAFMRIFNADGSEAGQCGNGTRCIAALVMEDVRKDEVRIETNAGVLDCHKSPLGIAIDMGTPSFNWREVPMAEERDTLHLGLKMGKLQDPCALSVGNPHAVFFVDDVHSIDLPRLGPKIETYFLFPERINVSVAQTLSPGEIRLRVWERGTGITRACGTAACATLAAASKRKLVDRKAKIHMDGGTLYVEWRGDDHLILSGAIEKSFEGNVSMDEAGLEVNVA